MGMNSISGQLDTKSISIIVVDMTYGNTLFNAIKYHLGDNSIDKIQSCDAACC